MGKIQTLSKDMIGKIAAGEVVERPSAAIKELVENSLDAGATAVTIEIRDGGTSYIRVADNGSGIDESDIRMAFERHATSKISQEKDLDAIVTLGFRGEALASIAAVSKVALTTRTAEKDTGLIIKNEGGQIIDIQETACPVGTAVTVRELFYNVPVRKGFLKKQSQEAAAVHDLIIQMMLSRPDVSFRYVSNGKTELHSPGDGQASTAMQTLYGGRAMKSMREIDDHGNGLLIRGYVGIGENARGNRGQEFFFINGRVMHSKILSDAVETGCRERIMIGKFPVCAIYITIPYDAVNVNVHPNKLEVRFRDETGVYEAVLSAVLNAMKEKDAFDQPVELFLEKRSEAASSDEVTKICKPVSESHTVVNTSKVLPPDAAINPENQTLKPLPVYSDVRNTVCHSELSKLHEQNSSIILKESDEQMNTILPTLRKPIHIFGALFSTYILVEYEDQLLLIDQHAVHERLLFDRLMKEYAGGAVSGQELLVPVVISTTKAEQRLLEDNRDALESIGLIAEPFGERDTAVRTMPMILGDAQTKEFIRDVISELENGKDPAFEKKRSILLQSACKHAVKGGESLTEDELQSLLDQMIDQKVIPTCPHGRPLVVSISHRELDKKFKRIQK